MDAPPPAADPLAQLRRNARGIAVKEALLDAALRAVAAHGYGGAGVAEIASGAGLTKNHIFQHFGSKEALVQAALERAMAVWRGDIAQAAQIFPQADRQLAHAAQMLAAQREKGWTGLEFIAGLAQGRGELPPALAEATAAALSEVEDFFRNCFKEARKQGRLAQDLKPRQLSSLALAQLLGSSAAGADPAEGLDTLRSLLLGPTP